MLAYKQYRLLYIVKHQVVISNTPALTFMPTAGESSSAPHLTEATSKKTATSTKKGNVSTESFTSQSSQLQSQSHRTTTEEEEEEEDEEDEENIQDIPGLRDTTQRALKALVRKLGWATTELNKTLSAEYSTQLATLIQAVTAAIQQLKEL